METVISELHAKIIWKYIECGNSIISTEIHNSQRISGNWDKILYAQKQPLQTTSNL